MPALGVGLRFPSPLSRCMPGGLLWGSEVSRNEGLTSRPKHC